MPEWSIGAVSKTVVPLRAPRVRIPVSPLKSSPRGCFFCWGTRLSPRGNRHSLDFLRQQKWRICCCCNTNVLTLWSKVLYMEVALKRNQSFRLPVDLIERLKLLARRENRSLNNYVETLLLDAAYHEPNADTIAAMREAESGALRQVMPLDLSSVEAMEKSMGT